MRIHSTALAVIAVTALASALSAQDSRSTAAAARLTGLLQQHKLDAVAARHLDQPGVFIAALFMPDSHLLVVSAPHGAPAVLDKYLAAGQFMEVYLALNAGDVQKDRFFVMDMKGDGLRLVCDRGEPFDSTVRDGSGQASFDGNWLAQGLSQAAYDARFAEDDVRYARLLQVLAATLSTSPAPDPEPR
jgi:hypothetical protein